MHIKTPAWLTWAWLWALTLLLAACGGGGATAVPEPPPPIVGSATIGPEGGTVVGPDGVTLEVPPGALDSPVTLRIARSAAGAPPLPDGLPPDTVVYEITPHELAFNRPVTVRGPRRDSDDGGEGMALVASAGGQWQSHRTVHARRAMQVERSSLSYYAFPDLRNFLFGCIRSLGNGDPYPCTYPLVYSTAITTTPTGALPDQPTGPQVIAAATLHFDLRMRAAADCTSAELTVDRVRIINNRPQPAERLLTRPINLLPEVPRTGWATASTLFDTALSAADNGVVSYRFLFSCTRAFRGMQVSGAAGFTTRVAIPVPPGAPTITLQPFAASVTDGQVATFVVRGTAPDALAVEWERSNDGGQSWLSQGGGTAVADGSDLTLTATLADTGALFRAQVCNAVGIQRNCIVSATAALTVTPVPTPPRFTTQPADITIVAGQTASFTAVAEALPPPAIRWEVEVPGGSFVPVTGEPGCDVTPATGNTPSTTSTCTIAQTPVSASRQRYRAVAMSPVLPGDVSSNAATLFVVASVLPPKITRQPLDATVGADRTASFSFVATGSAPITGLWSLNGVDLPQSGNFSIGACNGLAVQGSTDLQLEGLSPGCDGAQVRVRVTNGVIPDALSTAAVITVAGTRGALWSAPAEALGFSLTMGIPRAGLSLYNGAAVVDGDTLRLLGRLAPASVGGVQDNIQVVGSSNSTYRAVLYESKPAGSTACGAGSLMAVVVYQDPEGQVAVSDPIPLLAGTPGICLTYAAAPSARGFEFVARSGGGTGGTLVAGTFRISYTPSTLLWGAPTVSVQGLALSPDCANTPAPFEDAMANTASSRIDLLATPSRMGVLVFSARHATQGPVLCSTTQALDGSWSLPVVVWRSVEPNGVAAFPEPVVAMDPRGNALLVASRGIVGGYQLALGWLPAASATWQVETPLPAYGEVLPSVRFAPNGHAIVLYRTQPGAGASYSTVYAVRRLANGSWQPRQRLMGAEGDTRFPRLVMAGNGEALALFQHQASSTSPFQVQAARYSNGAWAAPQALQAPGSPEGRFAVAEPYYSRSGDGGLRNLQVWWREDDPANAARKRIMSSTLQFLDP